MLTRPLSVSFEVYIEVEVLNKIVQDSEDDPPQFSPPTDMGTPLSECSHHQILKKLMFLSQINVPIVKMECSYRKNMFLSQALKSTHVPNAKALREHNLFTRLQSVSLAFGTFHTFCCKKCSKISGDRNI